MTIFDTTPGSGLTITTLTTSSAQTQITAPVPTDVQDGEYILGIFIHRGAGSSDSVTPPAAFAPLQNGMAGNGNYSTHSWMGIRLASDEPASYTWNFSSDTTDKTVILLRIHSAPADIVDVSAMDTDEFGVSPSAPSVVTTVDNCFLLSLVLGKQGSANTSVVPDGMAQLTGGVSRAHSSANNWSLAVEQLGSAGSTGARQFVDYLPSNGYTTTYTLALKPGAPSGPTLSVSTNPISASVIGTTSQPVTATHFRITAGGISVTHPLDAGETTGTTFAIANFARGNLPALAGVTSTGEAATIALMNGAEVVASTTADLIPELGTYAEVVDTPNTTEPNSIYNPACCVGTPINGDQHISSIPINADGTVDTLDGDFWVQSWSISESVRGEVWHYTISGGVIQILASPADSPVSNPMSLAIR